MSSPFVGEIRIFCGNFAPRGWAFCNGQLLAISSNTALFSLLGTNYGGNGVSTFGLPNLQGRNPLHRGQGPGLTSYVLGEIGGVETVTLNSTQIPSHTHTAQADSTGGGGTAPTAGAYWGTVARGGTPPYGPATNLAAMNPALLSNVGGGLPHNNMSPYLALTFIVALQGIYPARS